MAARSCHCDSEGASAVQNGQADVFGARPITIAIVNRQALSRRPSDGQAMRGLLDLLAIEMIDGQILAIARIFDVAE